jgi:hypothetical protein
METNNANLDAYQKLTKTMKLNSEKNSNRDVVTLNVRGSLFSTFKETLMRFEYSYFYGLLNSGQFLPGPDGSYFIDRSPEYFGLIMDYLRTGELCKKRLTKWDIEDLEKELDYYLLEIPEKLKSTDCIGNYLHH